MIVDRAWPHGKRLTHTSPTMSASPPRLSRPDSPDGADSVDSAASSVKSFLPDIIRDSMDVAPVDGGERGGFEVVKKASSMVKSEPAARVNRSVKYRYGTGVEYVPAMIMTLDTSHRPTTHTVRVIHPLTGVPELIPDVPERRLVGLRKGEKQRRRLRVGEEVDARYGDLVLPARIVAAHGLKAHASDPKADTYDVRFDESQEVVTGVSRHLIYADRSPASVEAKQEQVHAHERPSLN